MSQCGCLLAASNFGFDEPSIMNRRFSLFGWSPIAGGEHAPKTGGPPRGMSAVIFIVALLTSGCAAQRTIIQNSGAARVVATDRAFVSLGPGAPPALSVIESDYANATRQTIALGIHQAWLQ
jgi:hypothetical protein